MIKYLKTAIFLLLQFLFLQGTYSQIQINVKDYLTQRFLRYCKAVPREEIFIHSDREEYIAGEDLWFNVYVINRQSFKPSLNSRIAYFELLNPENTPIVQKRILIDGGSGPGVIVLPDTLSSGTYTIRAYTSWMKNFLPNNCFMKDISIFNALSKKAFRGKTYSDNNINEGIVNDINQVTSESVPTLRVNNLKPDTLELFIGTDNSYRSRNNNILYLFIQTHGLINHVSAEKLLTDITRISIPKKELVPGINHITIFDYKGRPFCERFIYTPVKNSQFLVANSSGKYKKRDKISIDLLFDDEPDNPLNATTLSISVSPVANKTGNMELNDYMVFGTEFGLLQLNKFNGRKFSDLSPDKIDSLLLTVKSNWIEWEQILSDKHPVLKYNFENEDHYLNGELLNSDKTTLDNEEYLFLSSPGKVAEFQHARTDNKGNFSFRVHIDESVKDLIIQPNDVTKNYKINIESSFSNRYLQSSVSIDSTNRQVPSYISKLSVNYQVNKIYESSFVGSRLTPAPEQIKPKRFYGKPDIELIMADYVKLPVMTEVFFELIPGVYLKNKKSVYEISIIDPVVKSFYGVPPGMLIDGVIISDPSLIGNLDPELVEKIDVVKDKYFVGNYLFFGIVNVITKAGDYSSVTLPNYAIRMPYRVLNPVWSFVSRDYSSAEMKKSRIPDYRNTLYWNPSVKPGNDGKARIEFWSSDITSDYDINIQGITSGGKIFSLRKTLRVE
jgi:hypothetical protein